MKCLHINIRKATFLLLTVLINRIQMGESSQIFSKIKFATVYFQKPVKLLKVKVTSIKQTYL